jgi:hypothetical protein
VFVSCGLFGFEVEGFIIYFIPVALIPHSGLYPVRNSQSPPVESLAPPSHTLAQNNPLFSRIILARLSFSFKTESSSDPVVYCASVEALVRPQTSSPNSAVNLVTPEKILPLPKVVPTQPIKNNRKRGKTAIITSSPHMNELKNCQTPRHVKPPKQVKKYLFNDEAATKSNYKKTVKHRQKVFKT